MLAVLTALALAAGCSYRPLSELDADDLIIEGRTIRLTSAAGAVLEAEPDRLPEVVALTTIESREDEGVLGRGLLIAVMNERFSLDRPADVSLSDLRLTAASEASIAALLRVARTRDPALRVLAYRCLTNLADARLFSGLIELLVELAPRLDPSDLSAVAEARSILDALASAGRANGRYVRRSGAGGAAGALSEPWPRILGRAPGYEDPDRRRAAEEARALAASLTSWAAERLPADLRGRQEEEP